MSDQLLFSITMTNTVLIGPEAGPPFPSPLCELLPHAVAKGSARETTAAHETREASLFMTTIVGSFTGRGQATSAGRRVSARVAPSP
jgi:hypothetical protein